MPNKTNRNKKSKVSDGNKSCKSQNEPVAKERTEGSEADEESRKDSENISMLGHYITKEYELLRLVLSYLPLRDLYAAAQVCKTWQSAVEVIKRSRRARPQWYFWHCKQKQLSQEELPHHMFSRHFFSEPELCLMFMTRKINSSEINCRRSKAPCPWNRGGKRCNMKHRVLHYMRAELQNCPCIMVEGYGIVGSSHDLSFTAEAEDFNAYSGVLFPKAPNVSIKVFHFTKEECNSFNRLNTFEGDEIELFTKLSPTKEPIQCLLLFCKDRYYKTVEKVVSALETRQGTKFAVGGGFYDRINLGSLVPMSTKRHVCLMGIAFSGEGIHAASTVLGADIGAEQVSEAMEELQSCQLPGQDSVAFMFACVGRGMEWYMADNVESACFRHHFPSTPLIGYFGAGEIGHKFFPGAEKVKSHQQHENDRSTDNSIIRSYTSVFVYLSFNRQGTA